MPESTLLTCRGGAMADDIAVELGAVRQGLEHVKKRRCPWADRYDRILFAVHYFNDGGLEVCCWYPLHHTLLIHDVPITWTDDQRSNLTIKEL